MHSIRRAVPEDVDDIHRIFELAIRSLSTPCYSTVQIESWTGMVTRDRLAIRMAEAEFFVAVDSAGTVVGFASLLCERAELDACYVHPEHTRRGVGRSLCEVVEQHAKDSGVTCLKLVSSLNALEFYDRLGFGGQVPIVKTAPDGVSLPCVRMRKVL